jgi:uncharacterized integral membrane protein
MPWRLVVFLVVLALVVAFAGFNIQNVASISFGFYTLESVPVFLSLFAAFFLGVLVMLPFTLRRRGKKGKQAKKASTTAGEAPKLTDESARGGKKKRGKKDKKVAEDRNRAPESPKV